MVANFASSQPFYLFLKNVELLDFGSLAYQLMHSRLGPQWTYRQTTQSIARYLLFLYLLNHYPRLQLVPADDIDQVWHAHILDTQKYAADCQQLFGCFIHHFPYLGTRGESDRQNWQSAYQLTQQLFGNQFGLELGMVPADCEPLRNGNGLSAIGANTIPLRPTVAVAIEEVLQSLFELDVEVA